MSRSEQPVIETEIAETIADFFPSETNLPIACMISSSARIMGSGAHAKLTGCKFEMVIFRLTESEQPSFEMKLTLFLRGVGRMRKSSDACFYGD